MLAPTIDRDYLFIFLKFPWEQVNHHLVLEAHLQILEEYEEVLHELGKEVVDELVPQLRGQLLQKGVILDHKVVHFPVGF
jgi:hypothetical protein